MPERDGYDNGTPSWVDVSSRDLEGSVRFYSAVFGWEAAPPEPVEETGGYTMLMQSGRPVAGVGPHQDPTTEPSWSTYMAVDDCDTTAAAARDAGGMVVVEPMDVLSAGRMAFIVDPQGATFGLWQAGDHKGAGIVNEPNSLCWNELATPDAGKAIEYYSKVFGWGTAPFEMGPDEPPYTLLTIGENAIGGTMGLDVAEVESAQWITTFAVADCDAIVKAATDNGGTLLSGPADSPVGRSARLADPAGTMFQVMQLAG